MTTIKHSQRKKPSLQWMLGLATLLLPFFSPTRFVSAFQEKDTPVQVDNFAKACETSNNTFQAGEELTYVVYYNLNFVWLSAGEATFRVTEEDNAYHYRAVGQTYPSYEWFFAVNDRYDSWVDRNTLLPTRSERSINEGKYSIFERIRFDHNSKNTSVWRAHAKGHKETKTEHPVKNCVHDVLSILYSMRNQDLAQKSIGSSIPFSVFMDKEEYPLSMTYLGKEGNLKIKGLGRFNTMKYRPKVIAGNVFSEDSNMTVWVSDDQNRVPLLVESPVSVGSVKMVLKSSKNLKYPLLAKIK